MSKHPTPYAFRKWLREALAGEEFAYTTETDRSEIMMVIARAAYEDGRVSLFQRRLNGELIMVARTVSGKAKRFLSAAPRIRLRREPKGYIPFSTPAGRGLYRQTIPDGFDGPASRRTQTRFGGPTDGYDDED